MIPTFMLSLTLGISHKFVKIRHIFGNHSLIAHPNQKIKLYLNSSWNHVHFNIQNYLELILYITIIKKRPNGIKLICFLHFLVQISIQN